MNGFCLFLQAIEQNLAIGKAPRSNCRSYAESHHESVTAFLNKVVDEAIERDKQK